MHHVNPEDVSYEIERFTWEWDEGPLQGRQLAPIPKDTVVRIVDTTLRDGEQTAGVVFSNREKVEIAKLLSDAGVYQIEAGVPAMGGDEKEAISEVVKADVSASIMGWNRAVVSDIQASIDCGLDAVCISVSVSDIHIERKLGKTREWVLDALQRTVDFAKSHGLYVSANMEDASRADIDFLVKFAGKARDSGADRLRFCDTVGFLGPFQAYDRIKLVEDDVGMPIEMHMHNDFGMATANTLAGMHAGARFASVTVNGLGERAGNAALEEVVMALKYIEKHDCGFDTSMIRPLSDCVAKASGRAIPVSKPIVGENIFAHESGVHADGVLKSPEIYEAFSPDEVGGIRQIVIGKHSGGHALRAKFREFGIDLTDPQEAAILEKVRVRAVEVKRPLFDKELMYIYYSVAGPEGHK